MKHHVIVGAGPAGVIAAETIRKLAPHDAITLVGDEPEAAYSRMAIPYLLMGQIDERGTWLRKAPDHWQRLRIQRLTARVGAVEPAAAAGRHRLRLDGGSVLEADRVLLASGSKPVKPPVAGIDLPQVRTCWTLADARAIMAEARPGARVLQMGAGFIGCIILEALAARGVRLTVVEMGDRMVPRMMGPAAGGMIRRWVEGKGVVVHTGARVERIEPAQPAVGAPAGPVRVSLSTGAVLEADLVINATGVKPAMDYLQGSGITCLLGILTDAHMQTNVPGIYAAGDCAEAFDKVSGTTIVSAIQPNAADQAVVAARNMVAPLGQPRAELKGVTQINVLDTMGLISASFGHWQGVPGGQGVQRVDEAGCRMLSLQFDGDVLVGCNSVGWTAHIGVMRGLVEGGVRLGPWKDRLLQDPTALVPAYLAAAQAQGRWSGAHDARRR